MEGIEIRDFDAAEYLGSEEAQLEFLAAAAETNDPAYIAHALGVVAKARGMTDISRQTGITRQQLYRALSRDGNPTLETLTKVVGALGRKLAIV